MTSSTQRYYTTNFYYHYLRWLDWLWYSFNFNRYHEMISNVRGKFIILFTRRVLHFCTKNSYCQQHFLEFIKLQNVPKELSERVLDYIIGCRLLFNFQFFEASLNYWESLKRGHIIWIFILGRGKEGIFIYVSKVIGCIFLTLILQEPGQWTRALTRTKCLAIVPRSFSLFVCRKK